MARKNKAKAGPPSAADGDNDSASPLASDVAALALGNGNGNSNGSNGSSLPVPSKALVVADERATSPPLLISRNKHWRYISCYHGYWHQTDPAVMEKMAHINYNSPRPIHIHPGSFYDLLRIRCLVGEAKELIVKALREDGRKRAFQLRKMACQKLAEAYRQDEIATSVAVMQETPSMENVPKQVEDERNWFEALNPEEKADVRYVYFFQQKIPSRQVKEHTKLDSLDSVISFTKLGMHAWSPASYRTRALVRAFMNEHDKSIIDLKDALAYFRNGPQVDQYPPSRQGPAEEASDQLVLADSIIKQRNDDIEPKLEERPNSMEAQLLFQRGGMHLTEACKWLEKALPEEEAQNGTSAEVARARIMVKEQASRGLRDFRAFLAQMEYSPDMPREAVEDYAQRMHHVHTKSMRATRTAYSGMQWPNTVYRVDELFEQVPKANIPPHPPPNFGTTDAKDVEALKNQPTFECVTFHPLMVECLHSLLLCHCLVQTSRAELIRHTYMVSRLICLINPWPLTAPTRSATRLDWIDVMRKADIELSHSWDALAPAQPKQPTISKELRATIKDSKAATRAEAEHVYNQAVDASAELMKTSNGAGDGTSVNTALSAASSLLALSAREQVSPAVDPLEAATEAAANEREFPTRGANIARWMTEVGMVKVPKNKSGGKGGRR